MIASMVGVAVFALIALAFPLANLFAARTARSERHDAARAPRRGIAAIFAADTMSVERFLAAVVWTLVGALIVVLVPWAFAFDPTLTVVWAEIGVAAIVLLLVLLYAWRMDLVQSRRAVAPPTEPTE